jgi:hypothetical protein
MDIHRGDLATLEQRLDDEPTLVHATVEEVTHGPRFACTLLHIAAAHDDVAIIELLLRHGADVNSRAPEDWQGVTPIFLTLVRRGKTLGPASYADGTGQIERMRELGAPE